MTSLTLQSLLKCICCTGKCIEKGRIRFDFSDGNVIHIRVDGCAITDQGKKCDCMIIYHLDGGNIIHIFFVETKGENYSWTEAKEQLERSIEEFRTTMEATDVKNLTENTLRHMLNEMHESNFALVQLLQHCLLDIKKFRYQIYPTLCAKKKISLLKRVGYGSGFRLKKIGNTYNAPLFVRYDEDIFEKVKTFLH